MVVSRLVNPKENEMKKTTKPTAPKTTSAVTAEVPKPSITLTRSTKPRKGSSVVYVIAGVRGSHRFSLSLQDVVRGPMLGAELVSESLSVDRLTTIVILDHG
jgi:hypothetical protein